MFIVNEGALGSSAQKVVTKLWGVEYCLVNTEKYCAKMLKVIPGFQSSIHAHKKKDETFIGVQGTTRLTIHYADGRPHTEHAIHPGQQYRILPGLFHSFQAINVSWILEISTQHSDKDVIRLVESRRLEPTR
jgi:D-lyxose ketol-isomerase